MRTTCMGDSSSSSSSSSVRVRRKNFFFFSFYSCFFFHPRSRDCWPHGERDRLCVCKRERHTEQEAETRSIQTCRRRWPALTIATATTTTTSASPSRMELLLHPLLGLLPWSRTHLCVRTTTAAAAAKTTATMSRDWSVSEKWILGTNILLPLL